jgi:signal transduction histidine kinase
MNRSIRGRILIILFLAQGVLTPICATAVVAYVQKERMAVFDTEIQRRVVVVTAMVQVGDGDPKGLGFEPQPQLLPAEDLFVVKDVKGGLVGSSSQLTSVPDQRLSSRDVTFVAQGQKYRGRLLRAIPVDDEDEKDVAAAPPMVDVFYAIPTAAFDLTSRKIDVIAVFGSLFWIVSSCAIAWFSITRGMTPLDDLARQASGITEQSWSFAPSPEVRATSELRPLAKALEELVLRLGSALERERTFVGDAAHELKTAVAIAKSSLEVSLRGPAKEYGFGLERASEDVDRLSVLVNRMLSLASIEGSDRDKRADVIGLDETILAACDQLRPIAALHGVRLQVHLAGTSVVEREEGLLQTLWVTVIENAIHYSDQGSLVDITSSCSGGCCTVSVQDRGSGIPSEHLPHIFERFYRADFSRSRNTGGFGLGLSIAKAIVDRHQGKIQIDSTQSQGTTVVVVLPCVASSGFERALSQPSDLMA